MLGIFFIWIRAALLQRQTAKTAEIDIGDIGDIGYMGE
jgi:hypothetical protein